MYLYSWNRKLIEASSHLEATPSLRLSRRRVRVKTEESTKMITEILVLIAFLVENCTGIALVKTYGGRDERSSELEEALIERRPSEFLQDFTDFDQHDRIFQEFDPPESHEADPKAWRQSLPPFKTSLKECLKSVLLIQTVAGSIIGLLVVCIVILDFTFAEWCYNMNKQWDKMPRKVQSLRVTAQALEGALIEMWDFTCIVTVFPLSLIKDLHLLTLNTLAAFIDMTYRLYLQMVGAYNAPWMSFPLNALFCMVILVNNYVLARHFYPLSLKNTMKLDFILSAQFIIGLPASLMLVYGLFPWYIKQDQHIKVVIASATPLVTAIPKIVSRLGAQHLQGIIHPGTAHVLVAALYAASAVVFRVMQSELSSFKFFVAFRNSSCSNRSSRKGHNNNARSHLGISVSYNRTTKTVNTQVSQSKK
ncbi:hypothetical protein QZH41_019754 [Actinostola sp. cb2023]|nr:hypothetical protein QZH41_019754 [Actinostola sp. cb2023]